MPLREANDLFFFSIPYLGTHVDHCAIKENPAQSPGLRESEIRTPLPTQPWLASTMYVSPPQTSSRISAIPSSFPYPNTFKPFFFLHLFIFGVQHSFIYSYISCTWYIWQGRRTIWQLSQPRKSKIINHIGWMARLHIYMDRMPLIECTIPVEQIKGWMNERFLT